VGGLPARSLRMIPTEGLGALGDPVPLRPAHERAVARLLHQGCLDDPIDLSAIECPLCHELFGECEQHFTIGLDQLGCFDDCELQKLFR
jgi:hypothetical protein